MDELYDYRIFLRIGFVYIDLKLSSYCIILLKYQYVNWRINTKKIHAQNSIDMFTTSLFLDTAYVWKKFSYKAIKANKNLSLNKK